MRCPSCKGDSIVRKTTPKGNTVERFRTCKSCFTNYMTVERITSQAGNSKALKAKVAGEAQR